jgi:hypothetical protein
MLIHNGDLPVLSIFDLDAYIAALRPSDQRRIYVLKQCVIWVFELRTSSGQTQNIRTQLLRPRDPAV